MKIQHNIPAMNAYRNFKANNSGLSRNLEKLSSGYKINRAGDDAAGLAISEKMRAQITGLDVASKNAKDGISLVQTAEGALTEVHDMLNRMVTLAEQSANGTYSDDVDRVQLQKEVDQLKTEINRIADSTNFNGIKLLDGSLDTNAKSVSTVDTGAISNIRTKPFSAKGVSDAFDATYIQNRPTSYTTQKVASFKVSLNGVDISDVKEGDKITLNVGGQKITVDVVDSTAANALNAKGTGDDQGVKYLAKLLGKDGKAYGDAQIQGASPTVNEATTDLKASTATATQWGSTNAEWTKNLESAEGQDASEARYIQIGEHTWKIDYSTGTSNITFTQVDKPVAGEEPTLDYKVSISVEAGSNHNDPPSKPSVGNTQQPDWQVQDTQSAQAVGSAREARVSVAIDFSKLKTGDTLTAGNYTYEFFFDQSSSAGSDDLSTGKKVIDLSKIFKSDADLTDANKIQQAMAKITQAMASNATTGVTNNVWKVGNGGVNGTVGTLTFQSDAEKTDPAASATTFYAIGGGSANTTAGSDAKAIYMDTEYHVMKQFKSERASESPAETLFKMNVSKIKLGDTFSVDGVTFEFTKNSTVSKEGNVAIDLSSYGLGDTTKIPGGNAADALNQIGNAIKNNVKHSDGSSKYDVSVDQDEITLKARDNSNTVEDERESTADIQLPKNTSNGSGLTLQIGDTSDSFNKLTVSLSDMHASSLGLDDVDLSTQEGAQKAVDIIKSAINQVSDVRGTLGATQNRLDHTINNLSVMSENIQDAESTIRDTDIAEEMMNFTKNSILNQAAQAMLAQANQLPQGLLSLLGG